jgi:hypothetical protein
MQDPKLEREITLADKYASVLKQYFDLINNAIIQEVVTTDSEEQFSELRKDMSRHAEEYYSSIGIKQTDNKLGKALDLAETLHAVVKLPDFQRQTLIMLWHQEFMDVFYYRGKLVYRKELLKRLSLTKIKTMRIVKHPAVIVTVLVILTYILLMAML